MAAGTLRCVEVFDGLLVRDGRAEHVGGFAVLFPRSQSRGIRTHTPATSPPPGVAAVRSSGRFTISGRSLWARFGTYVAGSAEAGHGRLVQRSAFVDADSFFRMGADIGALTGVVEDAFWSTVDTHAADDTNAPLTDSAGAASQTTGGARSSRLQIDE
jgi:hypothetical protein